MYRSAPDAGPPCDAHPSAPARARCAACEARVCTPCSLYVALRLLCPRCAQRHKRRQRWWRLCVGAALVGLALSGIAAGGIACAVLPRDLARRKVSSGLVAAAVPPVPAAPVRHRCDETEVRAIIAEHGGDFLQTAHRIDNLIRVCPPSADLLRWPLAFQARRGRWDRVIWYATELIELEPTRPAHRLARAHALVMSGGSGYALRDYAWLRRDPSCDKRCLGQVYLAMRAQYASVGRTTRFLEWWHRPTDEHPALIARETF